MDRSDNCVIIQTLRDVSVVAFKGTENECMAWFTSLPESIKAQFMIYAQL